MNPTASPFSRQTHSYPFQLPSKQLFSFPSNFPLKSKSLSIKKDLKPSSLVVRKCSQNDNYISAWDEKPYEILPTGKISYIDEQDIVSFLDPPKELIPLDPDSYNPSAYLWLISRMWEIAGTRYQDAKQAKKSASTLLSLEDDSSVTEELWACRTSKGPLPIAWNLFNDLKKAIFRGKDGGTYGRIILGGLIPGVAANIYGPLYFTVQQVTEVMSTEQPCDMAYVFGDGLLDLHDFPQGFPEPSKHGWPFNDHLVIYVRYAGPGVLVGQAWQEGKDLEQVPKKYCGEILMVKIS